MTLTLDLPAPVGLADALPARALAGRSAVVTGSTSGIGLGIARALAAAGADVLLNGLGDPRQTEEIQGALAAEFGVRVGFSGADLSKVSGVEMLVEHAMRELGAIDILVNNAGVQHVAPIDEFPLEKWDLILGLNLTAAFVATRAVLGGMKSRGWGRILNVASAHGLVASPFKSAYVAAKHGLVGLTKVTALEGAQNGVTCNAICPGYVWTPLVERQIDDQARAHGIDRERVIKDVLLKNQPNKAFATVDELGALATFLCGESGRSITGAALPVDGGWTAH
ncbi:MAG: 3-hydroxybutyrate dehydrogenase [Alphaproteobacteria bacterium]|nr:3-hydroxybutyrate dehydrogenase [Alphaproteobacteria bacterium]